MRRMDYGLTLRIVRRLLLEGGENWLIDTGTLGMSLLSMLRMSLFKPLGGQAIWQLTGTKLLKG